jgi:hypothetical protein
MQSSLVSLLHLPSRFSACGSWRQQISTITFYSCLPPAFLYELWGPHLRAFCCSSQALSLKRCFAGAWRTSRSFHGGFQTSFRGLVTPLRCEPASWRRSQKSLCFGAARWSSSKLLVPGKLCVSWGQLPLLAWLTCTTTLSAGEKAYHMRRRPFKSACSSLTQLCLAALCVQSAHFCVCVFLRVLVCALWKRVCGRGPF